MVYKFADESGRIIVNQNNALDVLVAIDIQKDLGLIDYSRLKKDESYKRSLEAKAWKWLGGSRFTVRDFDSNEKSLEWTIFFANVTSDMKASEDEETDDELQQEISRTMKRVDEIEDR